MKILLAVLGAIVAVVAGALAWFGAFAAIEVSEREMGPYAFVYVQEAGTDFRKIGELTEALGSRLDQAGYAQRSPMQVYFPHGRGIQNQIGFLVDRPMAGADVLALGAETFYRPVPAQKCMVVEFPFRASPSFALGHLRVEPALKEYRAAHKYAETQVIVILDGGTIRYLQPIEPS